MLGLPVVSLSLPFSLPHQPLQGSGTDGSDDANDKPAGRSCKQPRISSGAAAEGLAGAGGRRSSSRGAHQVGGVHVCGCACCMVVTSWDICLNAALHAQHCDSSHSTAVTPGFPVLAHCGTPSPSLTPLNLTPARLLLSAAPVCRAQISLPVEPVAEAGCTDNPAL